jgi:hypothetical protein
LGTRIGISGRNFIRRAGGGVVGVVAGYRRELLISGVVNHGRIRGGSRGSLGRGGATASRQARYQQN